MNPFWTTLFSSTVFSAIINGLISYYLGISKSRSEFRVEWLKDLKNDTATYIFLILKYYQAKNNNTDDDDFYKIQNEFFSAYTKLSMYFYNYDYDVEKYPEDSDELLKLHDDDLKATKITKNYIYGDILSNDNELKKNYTPEEIKKFYKEYIRDMVKILRNPKNNHHKNKYLFEMIIVDFNTLFGYDITDDEVMDIINRTQLFIALYSKIEWNDAKRGK